MSEPDNIRDWEPGDGLVCHFNSRSPIPCGKPVKTAVLTFTTVFGNGTRERVVRQALCLHHATGRTTGETPGKIRAKATQLAHQRLAHEHWDEFQGYIAEALASLADGGEQS